MPTAHRGRKTTGKVLVEAPIAGIEANQDRDAGFRAGLAEKCPNIDSSLQNYNNNDIGTAASQVNDAISANPDLVGVFADNNSSGVGAATAIKDNNAADTSPSSPSTPTQRRTPPSPPARSTRWSSKTPTSLPTRASLEAAMATQGRIPPAVLDPGVDHRRQRQHDRPGDEVTARAADGPRPPHDDRKPDGPAVLELTDVSKAFGPVQALNNVSLKLVPGQVHCLAGENGAGKSTLIKVLTGALHRDSGSYDIEGQPVTTVTPAALRAAGVQAVYQELSLLPASVGRREHVHGPAAVPDRDGALAATCAAAAAPCLDRLGLSDVSPDTIVERFPAATKQLVEIAKVLTAHSVKVIVFDEPTTALTEAESDRLLEQIRRFREQGVAMLYVTHRLEEMFAIGDWVTVLRDGGLSQSGPMSDYDENKLITAMVGREVSALYPDQVRELGPPG